MPHIDYIAFGKQAGKKSIVPLSRRMRWRNGCRPMALPAPSIISTRKSAAHSKCPFGISRPAPAIRSAANIVELVPHERLRYTDKFDDPNLPGRIQVTVTLKKVSVGTELNIVQEGMPDVIPPEACYLGWQDSSRNLAQLVEPGNRSVSDTG